jgi:ABC-type transport system involved in cytochrome c biogenesis permease subunit
VGETAWSRALKLAGMTWIILGSIASLLWLFKYRPEHAPGPEGWLYGVIGLLFALSLGALLNLIAQLSDYVRARSSR